MTSRRGWALALAVAVASCLAPAHADSVGLLSQTGLISGRQSFVFAMQVATPGTLSVQLSDLNWQGRLADLSFSVNGPNGLLAQITGDRSRSFPAAVGGGPGNATAAVLFDVTAPGTYYAYVSGKAIGAYGIGLYSLNATFSSNAVPLPAAAWLLLSGVGCLWRVGRRATVAAA